MTREEFINKIIDRHICLCSNAYECAQVTQFLLDTNMFRLYDPDCMYHLHPETERAKTSDYFNVGRGNPHREDELGFYSTYGTFAKTVSYRDFCEATESAELPPVDADDFFALLEA